MLKFQSTQVGAQVTNIPSSQFSQFPSTQITHIPNFPSMYSSSQVPKVPTYPRSQVPKFLCTQVPKKVFEKSYIGTYCCRLHQYEIPNALPATSRCEMDVTFAGNSNEVTPWCKIEFNYRNDFDNYTRWKLREVIKVVVYLYNFFSVLLAWYKSKDCMSIDNGIFWENKASVSKKKFPVVFHWCSAGMKFIV